LPFRLPDDAGINRLAPDQHEGRTVRLSDELSEDLTENQKKYGPSCPLKPDNEMDESILRKKFDGGDPVHEVAIRVGLWLGRDMPVPLRQGGRQLNPVERIAGQGFVAAKS